MPPQKPTAPPPLPPGTKIYKLGEKPDISQLTDKQRASIRFIQNLYYEMLFDSPEFINSLKKKIEASEKSEEEKRKLLDFLSDFLERRQMRKGFQKIHE